MVAIPKFSRENSFRPIPLSSFMLKTMENIIVRHIMIVKNKAVGKLEKSGLLPDP